MNSRRAFREIVRANREGSAQRSLLPTTVGTLRLFILFLMVGGSAFAQNIQAQQYDINDPRNPNCPCHKYQKMADDAYQQQLKNDNINNNDNNNKEQQQFSGNFSNLNPSDNNRNNDRNVFVQNLSNFNISNDNNRNKNPQLISFNNIKQQKIDFDDRGTDNSSHKSLKEFEFKSLPKRLSSGSSGSTAKKKKPGTFMSKKLNRTRLKHSKIKKVRPDYSVCYKW